MITHMQRTILGDIPVDWGTITLRDALSDHKSGDWGSDNGEVKCSVLRVNELQRGWQNKLRRCSNKISDREICYEPESYG